MLLGRKARQARRLAISGPHGQSKYMTAPDKEDPRHGMYEPSRPSPVVLWIGGSCIVVELVLQAADFGLIGSPLWRSLAYQNGAFWPGLLRGWQANYSAQPVLMFVTYAFLHGGFGHLAGNMLALLALGRIAAAHIGQRAFAVVYTVSALGGAATFGVLAQSPQPMVGASGALFGLAGAWLNWDYVAHRRLWRLIRGAGFLAGLNVVLWFLLDGALAWQAHLGGFLAGWITVALLKRRQSGGWG